MSVRPRRLPVSGLVFGLALVIVASVAAREPVGLRGSSIAGETGLRLLVDDAMPFLFDVDSGPVTRLRGFGTKRHDGYVLALARAPAVRVHFPCRQRLNHGRSAASPSNHLVDGAMAPNASSDYSGARLMKQKQYSSSPFEPSPGARKCSLSTMWL